MKHIKTINEYNSDNDDDLKRYRVWEVISFKNKETGEIVNEVPEEDIPIDNEYLIKYYRGDSKYSIFSVKRTTDNEIFTIGDTIGWVFDTEDRNLGKIDQMWINGPQLRIDIRKFGIPLTDDVRKM